MRQFCYCISMYALKLVVLKPQKIYGYFCRLAAAFYCFRSTTIYFSFMQRYASINLLCLLKSILERFLLFLRDSFCSSKLWDRSMEERLLNSRFNNVMQLFSVKSIYLSSLLLINREVNSLLCLSYIASMRLWLS